MKNNYYLFSAGIINAITACLHIFGGQLDLVNPLWESNLDKGAKTQWLGGWHMITVMLVGTSLLLLQTKKHTQSIVFIYIGYLYIGFGLSFIGASLYAQNLAPQWILLIPIGVLSLLGAKKSL